MHQKKPREFNFIKFGVLLILLVEILSLRWPIPLAALMVLVAVEAILVFLGMRRVLRWDKEQEYQEQTARKKI
ncbi:hypothetical protein ACWOEH_11510 [Enterococcus nangangensis]